MYKIVVPREFSDDQVINGPNKEFIIYDQNNVGRGMAPKCSMELNEAGNLSFTMLHGHPYYDMIQPLSTFIKAYDDGDEIFYGRVLQRGEPMLLGQVNIQCEGALCFLLDSEVEPDGYDDDGNQKTRRLTREEFFRWCIEQHNAEVDDPRRQFEVGIITGRHKGKHRTYAISSYTKTKDILESELLEIDGGYLRIRPKENGRGHYIDWIKNYDRVNEEVIVIGENVEDQTNTHDGSDLFTVLRPVGKKDNLPVYLPEKTLDVYDQEIMDNYGRIVKTVEFQAETESELREDAEDFIESIKDSLFLDSSIRLVDMHYIDRTVPKVRLGDRFRNIRGLEGKTMTVQSVDMDFENVQNDTLQLKNDKGLNPNLDPNTAVNHSKSSTISRKSTKSAKATNKALKYYKELDDKATITVKQLEIEVGELDINVERQFRETAQQFERTSSRIDRADGIASEATRRVGEVEFKVETIEGTKVIQNSDSIWNTAGAFDVWRNPDGTVKAVLLKDGADFQVSDASGVTASVGERIGEVVVQGGLIKETIMGSALWTQRDNVTAVCGTYDVYIDPETGQKTLVMKDGADLQVTKDGITQTVGTVMKTVNTDHGVVNEMEGSALWTKRDHITGVCGEYDIEIDPETGKKTLVIKSGGGMKIKRDNVEYGLYDEGTLTGGLMVEKINGAVTTKINGQNILIGNDNTFDIEITATHLAKFGLVDDDPESPTYGQLTAGIVAGLINDQDPSQGTVTTINGDRVIIGNMGSLSGDSVETWMKNAYNGKGVFAKFLTVKKLTAEEIDVMFEDADFNKIDEAYIKNLHVLSGGYAQLNGTTWVHEDDQIGCNTTDAGAPGGTKYNWGDVLVKAAVVGNELQLTSLKGTVVTFKKAVPISSGWSGTETNKLLTMTSGEHTYKVRFGGQNAGSQIYLANFAGTPTEYGNNSKLLTVPVTLKSGTYRSSTQDVNYTTAQYTTNLYIDGTLAYNAGVAAGKPSSGTTIQRDGTSYKWQFAIKSGDGSSKNLSIDCDRIYSDARSGYTQDSKIENEKSATGYLSAQTITPSSGYVAMKKVTVSAPDLSRYTANSDIENERTVSGSIAQRTISPSSGKVAMKKVIVEAVDPTQLGYYTQEQYNEVFEWGKTLGYRNAGVSDFSRSTSGYSGTFAQLKVVKDYSSTDSREKEIHLKLRHAGTSSQEVRCYMRDVGSTGDGTALCTIDAPAESDSSITFSNSSLKSGSSNPGSSYTKIGSVNKNYRWVWFTITANGTSKDYKIEILQS